MERVKLEATSRIVLGKKVKKLRREGLIPANIFGHNIKSAAIQINAKNFQKVFKDSGETGLIDLEIGEEKTRPVLVAGFQKEPRSGEILHIDFHQVNLKEKVVTHVPVTLVGEAPVEKNKEGLILQTINELEIECLPTDIPSDIEVDISGLTEVGQAIRVEDLKVDREKCEVKNESEEMVVSVQPVEMEEVVEEAAPTPKEVEITTEKPEGEEGAEKKEEGKRE
ncbi:MAG: 50S ribosomal protein L25 [Patescibacteria group bacterium]|nr:50S ribosomal protein L25 [Patescibacteria group bacterium]